MKSNLLCNLVFSMSKKKNKKKLIFSIQFRFGVVYQKSQNEQKKLNK